MSRWSDLQSSGGSSSRDSRWRTKTGKPSPRPNQQSRGGLVGQKVASGHDVLISIKAAKTDLQLDFSLKKLIRLDTSELRKLPSQQVAHDLVQNVLIDALARQLSPRFEQTVLDSISCLLSDSLQCSVILAPLTVVDPSGHEQQLANAIGVSLMGSLLDRLPQSSKTLTVLVEEVRKRNITTSLPLDCCRMEVYFSRQISSEEFVVETLNLLRSIVVAYPHAYKHLKTLLFSDHYLKSDKRDIIACKRCRYVRGTCALMDLLHCDGSNLRTSAVSNVIEAFLISLPLEPWLRSNSAGSMKIFGENIRRDLAQIIRILLCKFDRNEQTSKLVTTILRDVPFAGDSSQDLDNEATRLVEVVAMKSIEDGCPLHIIDCFADCFGGKPRPEGGNTPISKPLSLWLTSPSSSRFMEFLLSESAKSTGTLQSTALRILGLTLQLQPGLVQFDDVRRIACHYLDTRELQADGLNLLVKYAAGRASCENTKPNEHISHFLVSTVIDLVRSEQRQVRSCCLDLCCSLLPIDWKYAVESEELLTKTIIWLNHFCLKGNGKEKQAAFKAMGHVIANCVEPNVTSDEQLVDLCDKIMPTLRQGLSGTSERAMAVFTVGNLAHGLRERSTVVCIVQMSNLIRIVELVDTCLDASGDKVVGNAIRTMGHLLHLSLHEPYVSRWDDPIELYRRTVTKLTVKLKTALGGAALPTLTWKERSSAKKHGWGSCHALGLALDCDVSILCLSEARYACAAIVAALDGYSTVNEKVIVAAFGALEKLSPSHLQQLCQQSGLVGRAVSCCMAILVDQKVTKRVKTRAEHFLVHIIDSIDVSDANAILASDGATSDSLQWLYEWMVGHNVTGKPYESFSVAFEHRIASLKDSSPIVGLEQRFTSRAAMSHRASTDSQGHHLEDEL